MAPFAVYWTIALRRALFSTAALNTVEQLHGIRNAKARTPRAAAPGRCRKPPSWSVPDGRSSP